MDNDKGTDSTEWRQGPASPRRRAVLRAALAGVALAAPVASFAQRPSRAVRIGVLACDSSTTRVHDGFRRGMRELGHVEGPQLAVEWRFANGMYERLPGLAAELLKSNVDVVVAATTPSVQAVRRATATIPIVMVAVPDPVGEGFAASLSRPGGNITGLSNIVTEVSSKHLELISAAVPRLARVAVLLNPQNASDSLILEQINGAAYGRGIKVLAVEASTAAQIDAAFAAIARARSEALIVAADSYFDVQRDQIAKLALANRLPSISSNREMTESGGMMSYGQDLTEHFRRAATYVDKILKGTKPGDLPIERPTVLELVISRRTVAALGIVLGQDLMLRADALID